MTCALQRVVGPNPCTAGRLSEAQWLDRGFVLDDQKEDLLLYREDASLCATLVCDDALSRVAACSGSESSQSLRVGYPEAHWLYQLFASRSY